MTNVGGISGDYLRGYIERIERLEEEKASLAADIRDIYQEAKGNRFDPKTMRQVIKLRRLDKFELEEQETLLDLYKHALGMLIDTPLGEAAIEARQNASKRTAAMIKNVNDTLTKDKFLHFHAE